MFDFVPIGELRQDTLLRGLPYKYLEFNDRTVVRRRYRRGEVVCREGEFGSTAWLIIRGRVELSFADGRPAARLDPASRIVGEMACLSHRPRTATIRAVDEDVELWEVRRNFLDMLRRFRGSRAELDRLYLERLLPLALGGADLLDADLGERFRLTADERAGIADYLRDVARCRLVDPGQVIVEQGEEAKEFFFIRLGNVEIARRRSPRDPEIVFSRIGAGQCFGELGILSALRPEDFGTANNPIHNAWPDGAAYGFRTTTCRALDNVELVCFPGEALAHLMQRYERFRYRVVRMALQRLRENRDDPTKRLPEGEEDFLDQGLFHAQRLLALDLHKCTRCDECTRACADSHHGSSQIDISRLLREGRRFGSYLVASSCRSCEDPYCLVGCPVDSIHRRPPRAGLNTLAIYVEDWCVGCGLCEKNCPYGSITMVPRAGRAGSRAQVRQASNCDLCEPIGGARGKEPMCVHACPHDAAHRMSGDELKRRIGL